MKHIKNIIFFDDYALWMLLKKEARKNGKKPLIFITEIIEKKIGIDNLDTEDDLYIACESEARKRRVPVAAFIEDCCREALGQQVKLKWYELPKA